MPPTMKARSGEIWRDDTPINASGKEGQLSHEFPSYISMVSNGAVRRGQQSNKIV